jgi:hypothetical protein
MNNKNLSFSCGFDRVRHSIYSDLSYNSNPRDSLGKANIIEVDEAFLPAASIRDFADDLGWAIRYPADLFGEWIELRQGKMVFHGLPAVGKKWLLCDKDRRMLKSSKLIDFSTRYTLLLLFLRFTNFHVQKEKTNGWVYQHSPNIKSNSMDIKLQSF